MSKLNVIFAAMAAISLAAPVIAAPVLVGNGTLNTANDLTVVQDGATTYEFLDLTSTYGQTIAAAVAAHSGQGFRWAKGTEVATLFGAFNLTYGVAAGGFVDAGASAAQAISFATYLGSAPGYASAALGWIDDLFGGGLSTYACIGTDCSFNGFVYNTSALQPPNGNIGTFLVRDNAGAVPEPGTLALVGLSLFGAAAARQRKAA